MSFKAVIANFLGNTKSENFMYVQLINNLLRDYKEMGCRMSWKLNNMQSYIDFFPTNLGTVSGNHGTFPKQSGLSSTAIKAVEILPC